jgi:hypothetical protein
MSFMSRSRAKVMQASNHFANGGEKCLFLL